MYIYVIDEIRQRALSLCTVYTTISIIAQKERRSACGNRACSLSASDSLRERASPAGGCIHTHTHMLPTGIFWRESIVDFIIKELCDVTRRFYTYIIRIVVFLSMHAKCHIYYTVVGNFTIERQNFIRSANFLYL